MFMICIFLVRSFSLCLLNKIYVKIIFVVLIFEFIVNNVLYIVVLCKFCWKYCLDLLWDKNWFVYSVF